MVFFMLPLQILAVRCGKKAFLYSAGGVVFGTIILKIILLSEIADTGSLIIADTALILFLVTGLYAVNFELVSFKNILKLLVATAVSGLFSIPVLYYLNSDLSFYNIMTGQLDSILVMFNGAYVENSVSGGNSLFGAVSADDMYNFFKFYFLNFYLVIYFYLLTATWWLGRRIGFKSIGQSFQTSTIKEFYVPEKLVWFYFIPLTIMLVQVLFKSKGAELELGLLGYAVSNSLYVMGTLYILQGFGLIQYLMEKRGTSAALIKLTRFSLVLIMLITAFSSLVALILSGLGVSELWINYRQKEKELIQ